MTKIIMFLVILLLFTACGGNDCPDFDEQSYSSQEIEETDSHSFSDDELRQDLLAHKGLILDAVGGEDISFDADDIYINDGNVIVHATLYLDNWRQESFVSVVYHVRLHYFVIGEQLYWVALPFVGEHEILRFPPQERMSWPTDNAATVQIIRPMDWDWHEIYYEEIGGRNWRDDAIYYMRQHTGIRVRDLWFEHASDGDEQDLRLVVDLFPIEGQVFNWGSTGGALRTQSLINSFASFPYVTEIEVLVGGIAGLWSDHFSFNRIFRVNY